MAKYHIPKDWIEAKAHLEEGHEIGAGAPGGLVARRSAAACSPRELARKIAERLLMNGFGDFGTRLEIKRETNLQKETSLGGWCLEAAVDQIAKVIEENASAMASADTKTPPKETTL